MSTGKRPSVRGTIIQFLEEHQLERVDARTLQQILQHVASRLERARQPSKAYVLDILLSTPVEVDRAIGGIPPDLRGKVRTGSLEQARQSLLAMSREYAQAPDKARAVDVHRAVMRSKQHTMLALAGRMGDQKRKEKQEILEWLLVWLENPAIFASWLAVRERQRHDP